MKAARRCLATRKQDERLQWDEPDIESGYTGRAAKSWIEKVDLHLFTNLKTSSSIQSLSLSTVKEYQMFIEADFIV